MEKYNVNELKQLNTKELINYISNVIYENYYTGSIILSNEEINIIDELLFLNITSNEYLQYIKYIAEMNNIFILGEIETISDASKYIYDIYSKKLELLTENEFVDLLDNILLFDENSLYDYIYEIIICEIPNTHNFENSILVRYFDYEKFIRDMKYENLHEIRNKIYIIDYN